MSKKHLQAKEPRLSCAVSGEQSTPAYADANAFADTQHRSTLPPHTRTRKAYSRTARLSPRKLSKQPASLAHSSPAVGPRFSPPRHLPIAAQLTSVSRRSLNRLLLQPLPLGCPESTQPQTLKRVTVHNQYVEHGCSTYNKRYTSGAPCPPLVLLSIVAQTGERSGTTIASRAMHLQPI